MLPLTCSGTLPATTLQMLAGSTALHARKDLAVSFSMSPLISPRKIAFAITGRSDAFGSDRLCSHLYPCGRWVLPTTFNPAPLLPLKLKQQFKIKFLQILFWYHGFNSKSGAGLRVRTFLTDFAHRRQLQNWRNYPMQNCH